MFEIIIKEIKDEIKTVGKDWRVVAEKDSETTPGGTHQVYDYTPEIEKTVEVEKTIYTQKVDGLVIEDVIAAVNNKA